MTKCHAGEGVKMVKVVLRNLRMVPFIYWLCFSWETKEHGMWEYYTLDCLLYFLKNINLLHPAYVKEAAVSLRFLFGMAFLCRGVLFFTQIISKRVKGEGGKST